VALNCTITKVNEKTIAVRPSMPEAIDEYIAIATARLAGCASPGKMRLSMRGNISPAATAAAA